MTIVKLQFGAQTQDLKVPEFPISKCLTRLSGMKKNALHDAQKIMEIALKASVIKDHSVENNPW